HHGGEEEAAGGDDARLTGRVEDAAGEGGLRRGAAGAQGRHQGRLGPGARRQAAQRSEGALMGNVLVVVEASAGQLRTASLPAITFGRQMAQKLETAGGKLYLLLLGSNVGAAADEAAKFGAEVLVSESPALEHYLAESYAPIVARAAKDKGASVVAATST